MYMVPFYKLFPEIAERETRVIVTFGHDELPADAYRLLESYCPDPDCDCRQVMLSVLSEKQLDRGILASVSYAFDWDDDMDGPFLDPGNPQSKNAPVLLEHVTTALTNPRYVDWLERHYAMVKEAAADPAHPAYRRLVQWMAEAVESAPSARARRVGRNDPCPCGSGKKYKHCCMRQDRER
jgi:hypothetical protein